MSRQHNLHITIGSTPSGLTGTKGGVDLSADLEMVKAAVLYADKATLCSPACSALFDGLNLASLSTDERIGFLKTIQLWFPNDWKAE
jgi:hypothetical protein